ncbi:MULTISPECIES: aspartate/glutamate racemase family protein [Arthrobacter]|uniref:Asp/Glu/hydantoin racemase n=1 Tax=Arthrobacter terricola TaxID=2547396 RepID=A0A4R5KE53_9MICC|nr:MULTISPECIES: aspartate/glutamate racemase family protein [Arthrobacter]MBT8159687.1 aspartate/glutamate racemase family protein [Arthrobacter sp. GN70]TDF93639.1 Asp/Glu/hydantoin racemase [Arthrobacter terricola]
MRLLVVSPNACHEVAELVRVEAERSKAPTTALTLRAATRSPGNIETGFGSLAAAVAVAELISAQRGNVDGVLVASFGDTWIPELQELIDVPVLGMTEAALCAAALQGRRISIVTVSERLTARYRDSVEYFGFSRRLASIRGIREPLRGMGKVQEHFRPTLVELARLAVTEDGADVVILAGAPLAGLARDIRPEIEVPVVDGVGAGIRFAEAIVGLHSGSRRAGSFTASPPKRRVGPSPAINAVPGVSRAADEFSTPSLAQALTSKGVPSHG